MARREMFTEPPPKSPTFDFSTVWAGVLPDRSDAERERDNAAVVAWYQAMDGWYARMGAHYARENKKWSAEDVLCVSLFLVMLGIVGAAIVIGATS